MEIIKNRKVLFVIGAFILVVGYLLFASILFRNVYTPQQEDSSPTPTPEIRPVKKDVVKYDTDAQKRVVKIVQNRKPLDPASQAARDNMIASLGDKSGTLFESNVIKIKYIHAPDVFMVEIRDTLILFAKREAIQWLGDHGVTQQGLCNLPVVFYLSSEVANIVKNKGVTFSPLPEGC